MGNFNRGGFGGGGRQRSFGNNRGFDNRGSGRPQLFKTICSKCGKECEVPFRPSGEKPVYCRDCFREINGGEPRRNEERTFSQPNPVNNHDNEHAKMREQLTALSGKVDKILSILETAVNAEQPTTENTPEEKPVVEKKKRAPKKSS